MNLPEVQSAEGYHALARARLDPAIWHYLQDGDLGHRSACSPGPNVNGEADDDCGNARALRAARIVPRPLRSLSGGHTRLQLLGTPLEHPLLLAPVAYQRLFHADGEAASAMAASAQGGLFVISSLASQPIGHIVQAALAAGGPAPWFQLYWQGSRGRTQRLLDRAIEAGCTGIVFTVDAPIKLATMQLPAHVQAVNLEAPEEPPAPASTGSVVFDRWMASAPSWDDLHWLRSRSSLPLLVKGLLHADDAAMAVAAGCNGVIVSNHGGRVLAQAPAALHALPPIVASVGHQVPVLFDSGVRSGADAFIALAHGATAVLVGRPYVWGLAANGALGVAHVLRLLRDELEMTMALAGCATLPHIGPAGRG